VTAHPAGGVAERTNRITTRILSSASLPPVPLAVGYPLAAFVRGVAKNWGGGGGGGRGGGGGGGGACRKHLCGSPMPDLPGGHVISSR